MTQLPRNIPPTEESREPGSATQPLNVEGAGLLRVAELADNFGAREIGAAARTAAERTSEGRFHVACVGQFKRGKSTLVNALVERPVLPMGIAPVTSVPTLIRYGPSPSARVRLQGGGWTKIPLDSVEQYVSAEKNPENRLGVEALEIFLPTPRLEKGMCLVDTPGLGSVFLGHSAATRKFIPHIDAAIIVIGADPPLSRDELELVEQVARETHNLIFILNKADRSSEAERAGAIAFARAVLESHLGKFRPAIFEVSALEQLNHGGSERDWPRLVEALHQLGEESGSALVRQAAERALRRAAGQLRAVLAEERGALERPLEESERRIEALRRAVAEAAQALGDLGVLLGAVQQRLSAELAARREEFLKAQTPSAEKELDERFTHVPIRRNGARYRRDVMRVAQDVAFERIVPWLEQEARDAESSYCRATNRFIELSNTFVRRFAGTGLPEATNLLAPLDLEQATVGRSRFEFHTIERVAAPASPLLFVADIAAGISGLRGGILRDAREFLAQLLDVNSSRAHRAVEDRLLESRRELEAEIRRFLRDAIHTAELALARARAAAELGARGTADALAGIELAERELHSVYP
ncbi:MAG TPA: dynamin family protein [Candidatus Sulfotelmatobacter sp.]|nr:dynamin family protein [Candidatus Sulfotelmatobacter sp.]